MRAAWKVSIRLAKVALAGAFVSAIADIDMFYRADDVCVA